ncbi:type II secretion system protein [bacterium]|nr:type II secretion system protein [bacterium]
MKREVIKNVPSPRGRLDGVQTICHSELVSESISKKTLKHLTAAPTDTGSHKNFVILNLIQNLKIFGSLCKVQGDNVGSLAPCGRGFGRGGKKVAFTLAEVLITLGVIGVVAAMTIPTLIANTNANKFRSQFKKTISTLSQAALMSKAQYGFDFADTNVNFLTTPQTKFGEAHPETEASFWAIFNATLSGSTYHGWFNFSDHGYNHSDVVSRTYGVFEETFYYTLSDGSEVHFSPDPDNCHLEPGETIAKFYGSSCWGWIDVNGPTKPNKEVTCSNGDTLMVGDENYQECVVKNDAQHMTDIYPVIFHDSTVEPATNAARYVLNTAK